MITEEAYKEAKEITDAYEEQQRKKRFEKIKKIKKELAEYFDNNEVGTTTITDFDLKIESYALIIIVKSPAGFSSFNYPDEKSTEDVREIGNKYDERLKFPYWMYPK